MKGQAGCVIQTSFFYRTLLGKFFLCFSPISEEQWAAIIVLPLNTNQSPWMELGMEKSFLLSQVQNGGYK